MLWPCALWGVSPVSLWGTITTTENGRLPDRYILQETTNIGYPQRTELNLLESDGTLIFSHGKFIGGSALTQGLAKKYIRPCLHIDLDEITDYRAVEIIRSWIDVRGIEVLNVAGSRASKDPLIYDAVKDIIKSVLYPPPEQITANYPKTVEEAVDRLTSEVSLKDKTELADQIFATFPKDVIGLKSYVMDCARIYYQRVFRDGEFDPQVGIY